MHEKVLPRGTHALLAELESLKRPELDGWTLAGGTGLALQMGHRVSDELGFFRTSPFERSSVRELLLELGAVETLEKNDSCLAASISGTELSFSQVPDPFLFRAQAYRFFELADPRDIALMLLETISERGGRSNFVDLYTILRTGLSLEGCLRRLPDKFGIGAHDSYQVLKGLASFAHAEGQPLPRMLEPFDWEECKSFFVREAHAIVLP